MECEFCDPGGVRHANGQQFHRVADLRLGELFDASIDPQLAEPDFYRDFPNACDGEEDARLSIFEDAARSSTQTLGFMSCPDQHVSVREISHSMYSLKSSSGASKSGATQIRPRQSPRFRFLGISKIGRISATRLPRWVM